MYIRKKLIRARATELVTRLSLRTPPIDVEGIIRSIGNIRIDIRSLEDDVAGFLIRKRGSKTAVIGINSNQARTRARFTLAHELGHYLLHLKDDLHVDQKFTVKLRSSVSSQGVDFEEMEANLFAAELLMPHELLEREIAGADPFDFDEHDFIESLGKKFRVSGQAMSIRLSSLGLITI